jgi:hypothetical protein
MKKDLQMEKTKTVELKNPKMMKEDPKDVEMKDADKKDESNEEPKKDADLLTLEGIYCGASSFI